MLKYRELVYKRVYVISNSKGAVLDRVYYTRAAAAQHRDYPDDVVWPAIIQPRRARRAKSAQREIRAAIKTLVKHSRLREVRLTSSLSAAAISVDPQAVLTAPDAANNQELARRFWDVLRPHVRFAIEECAATQQQQLIRSWSIILVARAAKEPKHGESNDSTPR